MLDPDKPSLYHRVGEHDAIVGFVDDLLPRLTGDPWLAVYWKGKSTDSMRRDRQLLIEFLCMAFGGPSDYLGRDMKTSHEGLGITEEEWDIFARHTADSLAKLNVPEPERAEIFAAAESLKGDIVEVPRG